MHFTVKSDSTISKNLLYR